VIAALLTFILIDFIYNCLLESITFSAPPFLDKGGRESDKSLIYQLFPCSFGDAILATPPI
jgi:hypothetical protein